MLAVGLVVPVLFWLAMKYFAAAFSLVELVAIYGYSFVVFVPAVTFCIYPWTVTAVVKG